MKENYELRKVARDALDGNWFPAIIACLVYGIISGIIGAVPIAGFILAIFLTGPLMLGFTGFFVELVRNDKKELNTLFSGFNNYFRSFTLALLRCVFTILWLLLLIVPGIIASYSYAMSFYILKDNPGMDALDVIRKSKEMMKGKKWKLFVLQLSFIGWLLLAIITLGIGLLFLVPYYCSAEAAFYEDLKKGSPAEITEKKPRSKASGKATKTVARKKKK